MLTSPYNNQITKNLNMRIIVIVFTLALRAQARPSAHSLDNYKGDIENNDNDDIWSHVDNNEDVALDWPISFLYFKKLPPKKLKQMPGKILQIKCEVVGKPLPTVKWLVGNYPISELRKQDSNIEGKNSSNVYGKVQATHIVDYVLHKPVKYTCVAHDGIRTIYTTTVVYPCKHQQSVSDINFTQQEDDMRQQQKPSIIYSHLAHFDTIGSSVLLPCRVYAKPAAVILWLDASLNRIEENNRFKLLPSGDLLITELQTIDVGTFRCIASNSLGIVTATSSIYSLKK